MTDQAQEMVNRLLAATNAHDLEALVACFAPDYTNETPMHPARNFAGRDQVRRNWEQIFGFVPDLRAEVVRTAVAGDAAWTEWEMTGTRRDGSAHRMVGVVIFTVRDGQACSARFYLEPVDEAAGTVDDAVRAQVVRGMILVAGGTGRLGTLVVRRLARDGAQVRVLTRDRGRAQHLAGAAAEVVVGDVRHPDTLPAALRDVTTVVSAVQGFEGPGRVTPASVDRDGNAHLIDAAAAAGADVVLLSIVNAAADSPMELFRAKYAAEQHLRTSGAPWTIVRATSFIELWAEILAKRVVFGRGDNPINFVSVHDVAAVVTRAVQDRALRGQTLDVGGPDNLTMNQLVAELQSVSGDAGRVRHVPRPLLRVMAPLSRRAAAAVAMDTVDLTFHPAASAVGSDLQLTDSRTALRATAG